MVAGKKHMTLIWEIKGNLLLTAITLPEMLVLFALVLWAPITIGKCEEDHTCDGGVLQKMNSEFREPKTFIMEN